MTGVMEEFCGSVQALLERTGYTLDVTTGQRKYGGPPPECVFTGPQPSIGTEVTHTHRVLFGLM